jgi:hypothetical protein
MPTSSDRRPADDGAAKHLELDGSVEQQLAISAAAAIRCSRTGRTSKISPRDGSLWEGLCLTDRGQQRAAQFDAVKLTNQYAAH